MSLQKIKLGKDCEDDEEKVEETESDIGVQEILGEQKKSDPGKEGGCVIFHTIGRRL